MNQELERNAENIRILESIAEKLGNDMGARLIEVKACSSEFERLKTTCLAQEAEIARLQAWFNELKQWVEREKYDPIESLQIRYIIVADDLIEEINRITGVKE